MRGVGGGGGGRGHVHVLPHQAQPHRSVTWMMVVCHAMHGFMEPVWQARLHACTHAHLCSDETEAGFDKTSSHISREQQHETSTQSTSMAALIASCKPGQCFCTSAGGDTCDGAPCVADQCTDWSMCDDGGYWCVAGSKVASITAVHDPIEFPRDKIDTQQKVRSLTLNPTSSSSSNSIHASVERSKCVASMPPPVHLCCTQVAHESLLEMSLSDAVKTGAGSGSTPIAAVAVIVALIALAAVVRQDCRQHC